MPTPPRYHDLLFHDLGAVSGMGSVLGRCSILFSFLGVRFLCRRRGRRDAITLTHIRVRAAALEPAAMAPAIAAVADDAELVFCGDGLGSPIRPHFLAFWAMR